MLHDVNEGNRGGGHLYIQDHARSGACDWMWTE